MPSDDLDLRAQGIVIELSLTQQMRSLRRSTGVKFPVNARVNLLNSHLLVVPEDLWVNTRLPGLKIACT